MTPDPTTEGTAPESLALLLLVGQLGGTCTDDDMAEAMGAAIDHGLAVLGTRPDDPAWMLTEAGLAATKAGSVWREAEVVGPRPPGGYPLPRHLPRGGAR